MHSKFISNQQEFCKKRKSKVSFMTKKKKREREREKGCLTNLIQDVATVIYINKYFLIQDKFMFCIILKSKNVNKTKGQNHRFIPKYTKMPLGRITMIKSKTKKKNFRKLRQI